MYSASSISKHFVLVPILVVVATLLFLMRNVSSLNMTNGYVQHKCLTNYGKYNPGSQYQKNLDEIIHSFLHIKDNFHNGYASVDLGMEPDHTFVTFQCRGDSYGRKCRSCFITAQYELKKRCLRDKAGIIWYDQCLVEFSSVDTLGKFHYHDLLCLLNMKKPSVDYFAELATLISSLKLKATTEKKMDLYAAGEKKFEKVHIQKGKVYAMVQCIKELSVKDCEACLSYLLTQIWVCDAQLKQGGRIFVGNMCYARFELYPFVNSNNYYKF